MTIKLPKSVRVAAFDIEILEWHTHSANARSRFGEFSCVEQLIRIDESMNDIQRLNSLLHEINHAIFWAYDMHDEDKEERLVSNFATAWAQIFRDNSDVLTFINQTVFPDWN